VHERRRLGDPSLVDQHAVATLEVLDDEAIAVLDEPSVPP
jgi:hypothetical protein